MSGLRGGEPLQQIPTQRRLVVQQTIQIDFDREHVRGLDEPLQLPGRFRDMRADQHHPRASIAHEAGHGVRRHRLRRQSGKGGQQTGRAAEEKPLALPRRRQHLTGETVEIRLTLGIDHAAHIAVQGTQPSADVGANVSQTETLDLIRRNAPGGLFRDIVGQKGMAIAEHRIAGEFGLVDRHRIPSTSR